MLGANAHGHIVDDNADNLYTLRGAQVRDALKWSRYIDQMMQLFAGAEVYFGSHHWPIWGAPRIADFLEKQRDTYKFIHDQTIRLALRGQTPDEIYYGRGRDIPEQLEVAKARARAARLETNRELSCAICEPLPTTITRTAAAAYA